MAISNMTSTVKTTNAIRLEREMSWPHEAPTKFDVTSAGSTPASWAISARVVLSSSVLSVRVWMRICSSPSEKTCGSKSGTVNSPVCERTSSTVFAVTCMGTWKSVPPRNSMPSVRPRTSTTRMLSAITAAETMNQNLRCRMKL